MKLARVFCFLIILGSSAIAAHAQTAIDPFAGDAHVVLNSPDPACIAPQIYCIDLTYTGPTEHVVDLTFTVANPPGEYPTPPPFTCATNVFTGCGPISPAPPGEFIGFVFEGGDPLITNGETFSLSSNEPIVLVVPALSDLSCSSGPCPGGVADLTPEPGSALLYMTGLVFLVGFARKRFGANFLT